METVGDGKPVLFLEEWIDGATIHKAGAGDAAATETHQEGFAWNLYEHDLLLFAQIVPLASQLPQRVSTKQARSLKGLLGDFFLWGDSFRDGRLQSVLEESDDLKNTVISSLATLGRVLISSRSAYTIPIMSANPP